MQSLLLYVLPIAARLVIDLPDTPERWGRAALSIVPLLIVVPQLWYPRFFSDERREHVVRHATYAAAFTVSALTSVRWDVVQAAGITTWTVPLIAYLGIGSLTLWWFCLSHVLENYDVVPLRTHQGDVAVLPLTLVAIATFASTVPDEAFQYSRSIIFYVPVVVAWATLHFVAYLGFATSCITTYSVAGFDFYAYAGLVIGAAHLVLLEVRAPPLAFQFFPIVAALLCQLTPRYEDAPCLRPGRLGGVLALAFPLGVSIAALPGSLPFVQRAIVHGVGLPLASVCLPVLAGRGWVWSATAYGMLLTSAVLRASAAQVTLVGVAYAVTSGIVEVIAPCTWLPSRPPWRSTSNAPSAANDVPRDVHCPSALAGQWRLEHGSLFLPHALRRKVHDGGWWRRVATVYAFDDQGLLRSWHVPGLRWRARTESITLVSTRELSWAGLRGWRV